MSLKIFFMLTFLFINYRSYSCKRYVNYTLFSAVPENKQQLYFFHSLQSDTYLDVSFWAEPGSINHTVNLIVPPERKKMFLKKAKHHGIVAKSLLNNVQEAFDAQSTKPYIRRNMNSFDWMNYYKLEDIYAWLQDICVSFSDRVKLINMGKSAEGRNILGVRLDCKSKQKCKNIYVEGGIHAREWISHAFVTYLISQLVHAQETKTNEIVYAVKTYNWHIFPVVNPDGYVYTHKTDRQWRKNRRKIDGKHVGVDLNRNFDYKFSTVGVSQNPMQETYCGPKAFSEPETKAISNYFGRIGNDTEFYVSFHSYGQYFIIPYANAKNHKDNFNEVKKLAENALKKMTKMYNTKYTIGTAYDTVGYMVSGNSADWVKNTYRVPVSVNIELRDQGRYGFALPPKYILPTCEETMVMLMELIVPPQLSRTAQPMLSHDVVSRHAGNSNGINCSGFSVVIVGVIINILLN